MRVSSFFLYFYLMSVMMVRKVLFCVVMLLFCSIKTSIMDCSSVCCYLSTSTSFYNFSYRFDISANC